MDGYPTFLNLNLQRWKRFFIVQNLTPLVTKKDLELYFGEFGIERIRFIHNPEDGSCIRKALVLMKSPNSAARIIDKLHHRLCTDEIFPNEIGEDVFVTTVEYRGAVKIYARGRYKLYLCLECPWNQDTADDRTQMGLYLTRKLVRAFRGLILTTIDLYKDSDLKYTGFACLRFANKCDKEMVLKRTLYILKLSSASWRDAEDKDFWLRLGAKGVSEKVEGDEEGDKLDVESDEEGDKLDVESDEECDDEGVIDSDEDW